MLRVVVPTSGTTKAFSVIQEDPETRASQGFAGFFMPFIRPKLSLLVRLQPKNLAVSLTVS